MERNLRFHRPWVDSERAEVAKAWMSGKRQIQIAQMLGMSGTGQVSTQLRAFVGEWREAPTPFVPVNLTQNTVAAALANWEESKLRPRTAVGSRLIGGSGDDQDDQDGEV